MDNIVCKVEALGGTISTTDIPHLAEYKRLLRAKERGDLIYHMREEKSDFRKRQMIWKHFRSESIILTRMSM